ncbi:MAG: hypothetical protein HQM11_19525 [SAR324 cluster bacterium]|nr:hypothetical protein [SAR324 cluster bacterium]
MSKRKKSILGKITSSANHQVIPCNILLDEGPDSLAEVIRKYCDPQQPVVIISEGLINYFNLETVAQLWSRIARTLGNSVGGWYLLDNYGHFTDHPHFPLVQASSKALQVVARGGVHLHFDNDQEIRKMMSHCGFENIEVYEPKDYFDSLPVPKVNNDTLVRVIQGEKKKNREQSGG